MNAPCIISVAITGSLPRNKDNPAVPVTVSEQVESTPQDARAMLHLPATPERRSALELLAGHVAHA